MAALQEGAQSTRPSKPRVLQFLHSPTSFSITHFLLIHLRASGASDACGASGTCVQSVVSVALDPAGVSGKCASLGRRNMGTRFTSGSFGTKGSNESSVSSLKTRPHNTHCSVEPPKTEAHRNTLDPNGERRRFRAPTTNAPVGLAIFRVPEALELWFL